MLLPFQVGFLACSHTVPGHGAVPPLALGLYLPLGKSQEMQLTSARRFAKVRQASHAP